MEEKEKKQGKSRNYIAPTTGPYVNPDPIVPESLTPDYDQRKLGSDGKTEYLLQYYLPSDVAEQIEREKGITLLKEAGKSLSFLGSGFSACVRT